MALTPSGQIAYNNAYSRWVQGGRRGPAPTPASYATIGVAAPAGAAAAPASQPGFNTAYNTAKAHLADQGVLSSTAAAGTLADAQATDAYYKQGLGQKWFELMYSGALGKSGIAQSTKGIVFPTLPEGINSMIQNMFLPPKPATGPIGDAQVIGEKAAPGGGVTFDLPFYSRERDAETDRQNWSRINLAKDQFNWQKSQADRAAADAAKKAQGIDPWEQIGQMASQNLANASLDPWNAKGTNPNVDPSILLKAWTAEFGIDVVEEARKGNARAMQILKAMYPGGEWAKYFDADQNASNPSGVGTLAAIRNTFGGIGGAGPLPQTGAQRIGRWFDSPSAVSAGRALMPGLTQTGDRLSDAANWLTKPDYQIPQPRSWWDDIKSIFSNSY